MEQLLSLRIVSQPVLFQIRKHDIISRRRISRQCQAVACFGLQVNRDIRRFGVQLLQHLHVVRVFAVSRANRHIVFAQEELLRSELAT